MIISRAVADIFWRNGCDPIVRARFVVFLRTYLGLFPASLPHCRELRFVRFSLQLTTPLPLNLVTVFGSRNGNVSPVQQKESEGISGRGV